MSKLENNALIYFSEKRQQKRLCGQSRNELDRSSSLQPLTVIMKRNKSFKNNLKNVMYNGEQS